MHVWNELPLEIRNISNNKTFKNRVKYHLLQEQEGHDGPGSAIVSDQSTWLEGI